MTEEGVVLAVQGGWAQVETTKSDACAECMVKGACSTMGGLKRRQIRAMNQVGAKEGDRVLLALPRRGVMGAGFMAYIVPVLALMLGAWLGQQYGPQYGFGATNASVVAGLAGLVGAWWLARLVSLQISKRQALTVKVVRILQRHPQSQ